MGKQPMGKAGEGDNRTMLDDIAMTINNTPQYIAWGLVMMGCVLVIEEIITLIRLVYENL